MEMMLHELLEAYEYEDIEDTFVTLYAKNYKRNAVGYEEVFEKLKEMDDVSFSDNAICIEHVEDDYHHVYGKLNDERVSLSFTSWREWLGMRLDDDILAEYTGHEILCHVLWGMTFYGYNEDDIKKFSDTLEADLSEKRFVEKFWRRC
jgi:hypothetical protein